MPIRGATYGEPILAKHADGRLEVFVIGLSGHLYRKPQARPGQAFDRRCRMETRQLRTSWNPGTTQQS